MDGTFLVLNGDVLVDIDFQRLVALHREREAAATLALVRVPDPSAFGLVPVDDDDRVTAFLEKPGDLEDSWVTDLINAGVYVLEPSVLDHVPAGQPSSFERNLFPSLLTSGAPVYGYELHGYWRDLGTPIAYLAAQFDLLEGRLHLPINATERGRSQWFADDTRIAEGAVLRGPILVGQGATVEEEGRVFGPTVLGPGTWSPAGPAWSARRGWKGPDQRGAKVSDSIIGRGVVVGDGPWSATGPWLATTSRSRPATSWPAVFGCRRTSGWAWARPVLSLSGHPSSSGLVSLWRAATLPSTPEAPGRGAARR